MSKEFMELIRAMEMALLSPDPGKHNYLAKRQAVVDYVERLEALAAQLAPAGEER